ncbi:MAG TPA: DUF58 domain-containing protein, partial [Planctomycetaceae bacterium]|nr:DUF58 domain-containing protein [Planctomycetaceae bacterium]
DISSSMTFSSLAWSKLQYAATVAASLAWLMNRQGDAVGLTLFDDQVRTVIPPRYRPGHFRRLMTTLEEPGTGVQTDPSVALEDIARRLRKRGLVILISDLLSPVQKFGDGLRMLRGCLHDLVVFQVLDPAELTLKFDGPRLFEDLESEQRIFADPDAIRSEYLQRLDEHNRMVREECETAGASLRLLATDQPLELSLAEFLQARRQRR